ncbi:MAG: protein kinase [Bacteroidota bacterium]
MINERFTLQKLIGEGRSKVFIGEDTFNENRKCAIKIISSARDKDELKSFRDEFNTLKRMSHPSIITVFDYSVICNLNENETELFGVNCRDQFFVLEYFIGSELSEYPELKNEEVLLKILEQVCSALYYIHQSNYIYYDLKPENILVSNREGVPEIKFIDFGFASHIPSIQDYGIRGTAEYIAPEILKKEQIDHRADLYSLGIMLYKIIYGKYPFEYESEVDLYKAQMNQEPEFRSCSYSNQLIEVIKKLLSKNPEKRYQNSIQVIYDLGLQLNDSLISQLGISHALVNRKSQLSEINKYLTSSKSGEILNIVGDEGAGKSTLLSELENQNENVVLVDCSHGNCSVELWRYLLNKIVYTRFIYEKIDKAIIQYVQNNLAEKSSDLFRGLKSIFARISLDNDFILILDNVDFADKFSNELFSNIIPILQANNVKIIIAENITNSQSQIEFQNVIKLRLDAFHEKEINEFVGKSFFNSFNTQELIKLIVDHSDHLPGNVVSFIRDLFLLNIIQIKRDGAVINDAKESLTVLKDYQKDIYKIRFNKINQEEKRVVELLSLFSQPLPYSAILKLSGINENSLKLVQDRLREFSILKNNPAASTFQFVSESLRRFVYNEINTPKELHSYAADRLVLNPLGVPNIEIATQYEKASRFEDSFKILSKEIIKADQIHAYSYKEYLLLRIVEYPLTIQEILPAKIDLCQTYTKLGKYHSAKEILSSADLTKLEDNMKRVVNIEKGIVTKRMGDVKEGVSILKEQLNGVAEQNVKDDILLEIADGELDLNNYSTVVNICDSLIDSDKSSYEDLGRAYNLLGLVEFYGNSNLDESIKYFKKSLATFQLAEKLDKVAGMELNLGNIYNMKGDHNKSELHWNKALQINKSIGNIEQEALVLLNYGNLMQDKLQFEKAISQYKRAHDIFKGIGNNLNRGLAVINMGETCTIICEYSEAEINFIEALLIFEESGNFEEYSETLFLQAKLEFALNRTTKLKLILEEIERVATKITDSEKARLRVKFVRILYSIKAKVELPPMEEILMVAKGFYNVDYRATASEILLHYATEMIWKRSFEQSIEILNNDELISFTEKNDYFFAWRYLLIGRISDISDVPNLKSPIEYFMNSLKKVENLSIFEITWQIMFALGDYYVMRGNKSKSISYLNYSKHIIHFISENIVDEDIKSEYLSDDVRVHTLELINK